ncbi:MAG: hypothetical protein U1D69_15255 [Polynucleobacter sp.]|nr:hypothetical protein [Polynucleobacter sp.]
MRKTIYRLCVVASILLASIAPVRAADDPSPIPKTENTWRFEVTPYLWSPGLRGTLNLNNAVVKSVDMTSSNVLGDLKSGGMISAEAHKGKWGIMGDFVSATLQKSGSVPLQDGNLRAVLGDKATAQLTVLTGVVSYTVANTKDVYVDALLGVRAIDITATVNVNIDGTSDQRSSSKKTSTVDPIIGAKGRYRIAESSWYIPFYGDIGSGGGTTNLTWQAMTGIGKTFNNLVDASLTYRALYFDMKDGGVLAKATMFGPQVAVTFKF